MEWLRSCTTSIGGVRYRVSRAVTAEEALFRYWEELKLLQTVQEKEISTVLLVFPELELFGNYELFEAYCECLQDSLSCSTLGMEDEFQLVSAIYATPTTHQYER